MLAYNPGLEGSSPRLPNKLAAAAAVAAGDAAAVAGVSTELVHERPELKILTWAKEEVASDALLITGETPTVTKLTKEHLFSAAAACRMCV